MGMLPARAMRTNEPISRGTSRPRVPTPGGGWSQPLQGPFLLSSAKLLMVAAGMKTAKRTGKRSKKGLREAAPEAYMLRKVRKSESPRKATVRR